MNRRKSERNSRAATAGSTYSLTTGATASTRGSSAKRKQPQKKKSSRPRKKHQQQQPQKRSAASSSRSNTAAANYFNLLDEDSRLKIFGYLTWQDLAEAAQVSKVFRDDCRHPSLTQNADRQMVDSNRFATYTKLKVVRGGQLQSARDADAVRIRGGRTIPQVTSLELSFDPSDDTPQSIQNRRRYPGIETSLWNTVAEYLPNLRHLTVSHNMVAFWAPQLVSEKCPDLDSLTWRNQASSLFLSGWNLGNLGVTSIDMDGSTFCQLGRHSTHGSGTSLFDDEGFVTFMCIFDFFVDELERVSLRNTKYYVHDRNDAKDIPQRGLVKFVRRATNLRWFRSDLTPENVAMLQQERPDVTFVS